MAEREGFEPSVPFQVHTLSRRAPSTARTSLRLKNFVKTFEIRPTKKYFAAENRLRILVY